MPAEIQIVFEGHKGLESGFYAFFREVRERAREKHCRFRLIGAKSGEANRDFEIACKAKPSAWTILLRDSEGPPRRNPKGAAANRAFWMVEMMESWFHADQDALAKFYGAKFRRQALKANPNVEEIAKKDLVSGLSRATQKTSKGDYFRNKTSHGPRLLALIDPALVRDAAPNCDRLFQAILEHLN